MTRSIIVVSVMFRFLVPLLRRVGASSAPGCPGSSRNTKGWQGRSPATAADPAKRVRRSHLVEGGKRRASQVDSKKIDQEEPGVELVGVVKK